MGTRQVNVTGMVNAVDWDDEGRTSQVSIEAEDGEEYVVVLNDVGRRLVEFEGAEVSATGSVSENEFYEKEIAVSQFKMPVYELAYEEDEEDVDDE